MLFPPVQQFFGMFLKKRGKECFLFLLLLCLSKMHDALCSLQSLFSPPSIYFSLSLEIALRRQTD